MPEKGLRRGKGGGTEGSAVNGLAHPADSYVIDALLMEGSVDPRRDI